MVSRPCRVRFLGRGLDDCGIAPSALLVRSPFQLVHFGTELQDGPRYRRAEDTKLIRMEEQD